MSRLEIESELFEGGNVTNEAGCSNRFDKPFCKVDHEIAQLTNLKSVPNERLHQLMPGKKKLPVSPVKMLAGREGNYSRRGGFSSADRCHMISRYFPVVLLVLYLIIDWIDMFLNFQLMVLYSLLGFSDIRIYNVDRGWKVKKNILAKSLRWTVTDTSLSPDRRHLVYTSMSPIVHIVNVGSATTESLANITFYVFSGGHGGLDFSAADGGYSFGIFSVKFSTDGRELVAGSSDDSIYIYDLEANKLSLLIAAHMDLVIGLDKKEFLLRPMVTQREEPILSLFPVGSVVCPPPFAMLLVDGLIELLPMFWEVGQFRMAQDDIALWLGIGATLSTDKSLTLVISYFTNTCHGKEEEGNKHTWRAQYNGWTVGAMIYFTGEVLGRRCFVAKDKPAGVLMGHLEGVTFIDSRGDGRYFISNGKDQTIKLWDTRKMSSNTSCNLGFRNYDWDYRWMDYPPQARNLKHPISDQSIATYKGHSVLRTLIRCYFSPGYR
ncbi:hypothetical protein Gotur_006441 [Gossypium turneri]